MTSKIKFLAVARRWFDKVYGNTYHSVRVTRCRDGKIIAHELTYGYGDQYRQTALGIMHRAGWLPKKYTEESMYSFERENGYPIDWNVTDGLKRDAIANGEI